MSGWGKWSVKRKLFAVILLILALNVVVLFFMGAMLFERFYQANKVAELKGSAQGIVEAYRQNSETIYDELSSIENRNVQVSLLSVAADGTLENKYHSRANKNEGSPPWNAPLPPEFVAREEAFQKKLLERLARTDDTFLVEKDAGDGHKGGQDAFLSLSVRLDENLFLYIQTSLGYIKSTADLAVRYTALLSLVVLLCGAVGVYFIVARITSPLSEIGAVAGQIAKLDFSRKCAVRGGDEIALLAVSINHMSDDLQEAVTRMIGANEVLQSDLVRQQQTDRMRRQFIANVSHDFKTPLTLMISYAEALREQTPADSERREHCDTIISEGNKLSRMVGKMLGLSKLESGVDKVEYSYFCLNEALDAVIKGQQILTERQGLHVTREQEDEFIVRADYQKIEQVIANLFGNAVKYAPAGGEIVTRAVRVDDCCRVEIENTGAPIGAEDLGSLFESFYRADAARTAGDSYGLGLAIVKVVMEAHGRAYGAHNTDGGVCFWFEVELADFDDADMSEK